MISLSNLADQLADERDVPSADMLAIIEAYAGQINDDADLYDREAGELTDAGAELIVTQLASAAFSTGSMLDEIIEAQTLVDAAEQNREARDATIRAALKEGVPVREIVAHTGLSRERVYQIRDGRR